MLLRPKGRPFASLPWNVESFVSSHMEHHATSPELAGGTGFTFEDIVVAYYLAALLRQERAAGQEGTVTSVAVQQAGQGHPMDDVIVEFNHDGTRRRLSLQVKREIVISAAPSNGDFRQIMAGAVATRATPGFQPDLDVYGFVVEHVAMDPFRIFTRLIERAKSSPVGEDFVRRFDEGGAAGVEERRFRDDLSALTEAESPEDEAAFYRRFAALKLDGLMDGGPRRAEIVNRLQELVINDEDGQGLLLFDRLCRIAREGAGTARIWTRQTLLSQLRGTVRLKVIPNYQADVDRLRAFSVAGMADVSEEIAGYRVERPTLEEKIKGRLAEHRLVSISGLPGCGKSAMLKRIASEAATNGPVLFLKADRLEGTSWQTFAVALGVRHSVLIDLLAEIGSAGTSILFIDGIDRIRPDQKGIILDIVRALEANEYLSNWKVLASSRNQGLEAYRTWFPVTFYSGTGIGDIPIEPFSDDEAEVLAEEQPYLRQLLFGPVAEIARRPFFAAVLAQSFPDGATAPQTEVDLIDAWWARAGHDAPEEAVPQRQRALLDLAENGVRNLGKNIATRDLEGLTVTQIPALKGDHVIRDDDGGASYSFTHDIFFEWVFFRLLIEHGADWQRCLTEAGEPPLLGRAVGLLAQHALVSPGKWTEGYRELETRSLRPQWCREWLTAPPFTAVFAQRQQEFQEFLSANDYAFFEKLLVWFQAQHTVPNPLILKSDKNLGEGVDRMRAADLLGWPSDFQAWSRLLDWLLPLAPNLPTRLLPGILDLFGVWQNIFAGSPNPRSSDVLNLCNSWLIDLEGLEYSKSFSRNQGKWSDLDGKARSNLVVSLRFLILRSAQAYPEPAIALFKRAIANDRMRSEAHSNLMHFTSTMVDIAPDHVVALAEGELMKELPQDRIDRARREERAHFARLEHIRAIPEKDRTDAQQRALRPEFFPISPLGHDHVERDDIGIDRYHRFYSPASARHEPFVSLFAKKPDTALRLVRDLANHATQGWRQGRAINRKGTPLPVVIEFPWGTQTFWGDWRVYSWFMGELAPYPLECTFLALSHWAFKQIEGGRPTDEIIRVIVEGNECYAVLGLALALALETFHVSETTLPIVTCQRLWHHDRERLAQEPTRDIDLFGFGLMSRLTSEQAEAKKYLDTRASRKRGVRELVTHFVLGPDENLRLRLKAALARFPDDLPYEIEEARSDPTFTASLRAEAEHYAGLGDITNYRAHTAEDEQVFISYQAPVPPTPEQTQQVAASAAYLQEMMTLGWAKKSLADNALSDDMTLADAVALARERDEAAAFKERQDVGEHAPQSMIAAIAACIIRFGAPSNQDREWALDVLARIEGMKERSDTFYGTKIPWHPTISLTASLAHMRGSNPSDVELARRLMRLTAYPLEDVSNLVFAALFRDPDPRVAWITAQLALELAIYHRPEIKRDGRRDDRVNQAVRKKSLRRALRALGGSGIIPLPPLPAAWVRMPRRGRDGQLEDTWTDPNPLFDAQFAASVFQHLPIEAWCQSDIYRPLLQHALKQFVAWTAERLMPSWRGRGPDDDLARMIEWTRLLGDLLARAAPYYETEMVRKEFLAPFLTDDKNGLLVLAPFADRTVARHVLDAETIPSNTFDLLNDCVERVVRDQSFNPTGYRAGEVRGSELPELIQALLCVAVEKADGAARFVNGDWSQISLIMPLVTRLVTATGWSPFVMGQFLTLCERAGAAYPLDAFAVQANAVLAAIENAKDGWAGTLLPARIASVVQCLAEAHFPLQADQARELLRVLDTLIDLGDRRSAALEQTEAFIGIRGALGRRRSQPTTIRL